MPIYEYHCRECGERFDKLRPMSQRAAAPKCPVCESERTELAVTAPFVSGGGGGASGSCNSYTGGG